MQTAADSFNPHETEDTYKWDLLTFELIFVSCIHFEIKSVPKFHTFLLIIYNRVDF